jgi:hypothetical protein
MSDLRKLKAKLCRELSQSERSAIAQPRREARRLGDVPPAHALLAISEHASAMRPRLDALIETRTGGPGLELGKLVGELFSVVRHGVLDRLIGTERSYRGTLLGIDHGADIVRMLAAIAARDGDEHLALFCSEWLRDRLTLVERARGELAWFADQPAFALQSGLRRAIAPASGSAVPQLRTR